MATPLDVAPPTSPRGRALARRMVLALAGVIGVLAATVPAQAAPTTSGEAAQLVAARGHELEVISEQFNEAREALAAQQAAAQAATAALEQATASLGAAQQQVRGSADDFVDRMSTLQLVAGHQNGILQEAAGANVAAAQAQATAQRAAAEAQAQFDEVTAQQADLQAQVAEYQALYDQLSAQEQRTAADVSHGDRASRSTDREPPPAGGPVVADSEAAQLVVDAAMAQRGKPYVWAASGPASFDCSGLTSYAFRAAGIGLPHSSAMQSKMGQSVSRDQLQPGDLIFFYSPVSHVGIYIGNGQMVHAPTSGDVVKVAGVDSMGGYSGARRLAA
jgi:cell wall-associated NlpC family hydrolase